MFNFNSVNIGLCCNAKLTFTRYATTHARLIIKSVQKQNSININGEKCKTTHSARFRYGAELLCTIHNTNYKALFKLKVMQYTTQYIVQYNVHNTLYNTLYTFTILKQDKMKTSYERKLRSYVRKLNINLLLHPSDYYHLILCHKI